MSVKAFIFAVNNLWRYIDNLMDQEYRGGKKIDVHQNQQAALPNFFLSKAESSSLFCTKLIQEFPILIVNRRNFINLLGKKSLTSPVIQDRPKISKHSQDLAKKRFLDVDLDGERESLDSLILEFEMGKISSHTPIHERLYNEVF